MGKHCSQCFEATSIGVATNADLVNDLKRDSTTLTKISKQFVERGKSLVIYTFYETQKLLGVLVRICAIYTPHELFNSASVRS